MRLLLRPVIAYQHTHTLLPHHYGLSHINNPTQRPNSIRPVYHIPTHTRSILHDTTRHHNHILRRLRQLLDNKVHHLAEGLIFVLEELGDAEEEGGGFVGGEFLAGLEEEGDFGEQDATSSR